MFRQQIPRAVARILFETLGAGCILALTASSFDIAEMVALGAIAFLLVVVEAAVMCSTVEPWWKGRGGKARPNIVVFTVVGTLALIYLVQRSYPLAKARIEIAEGVEYEAMKRPFEHWSAFADRIIKDADAIEAKHERKR